jgi:group I intron endonuclease
MVEYNLYLITNLVNHRQYVGITSVGYLARWQTHLTKSKSKEPKHRRKLLYKDIRKFGPEKFECKLLKQAKTWSQLEEFEQRYIRRYKTFFEHGGYNMTLGGRGILGYRF